MSGRRYKAGKNSYWQFLMSERKAKPHLSQVSIVQEFWLLMCVFYPGGSSSPCGKNVEEGWIWLLWQVSCTFAACFWVNKKLNYQKKIQHFIAFLEKIITPESLLIEKRPLSNIHALRIHRPHVTLIFLFLFLFHILKSFLGRWSCS